MKVGFVGLGVQGKGLAVNAVTAGHEVTVFDPHDDVCQELARLGAKVAPSNAALAQKTDCIQVCVLNDQQLNEVFNGKEGIIESAAPGTIVAIHSTVKPSTVLELASQAQSRGLIVIDAPVSGGAAGAAAKTMSFIVGGPLEALEKMRPVFSASGTKITHVGGLGQGMKAKLAHQMIISLNLLAAYEGMKLGVAAGLDEKLLEQIVREGAAQSYVANQWSSLKFGPHAPDVFYKDLNLCIEWARSLGVGVPGAALTQQMIDDILRDHR